MSIALTLSVHDPEKKEKFWDNHKLYEDFAKTKLLPCRDEVSAQAELYYREYLDLSKPDIFMPTKLPPLAAFRDRVNMFVFDRCLIATEKGFLGLVPNSAKPGDNVAFVRNSTVPFIVRKVDGGRYELVGEAYVHGLMHGELKELGPLSLEEIILQ